jgi:hypothetical protein
MLGDVLSWKVGAEQLEAEGEVTLGAECVQKLQGHHVSSSGPLSDCTLCSQQPCPPHRTSLIPYKPSHLHARSCLSAHS